MTEEQIELKSEEYVSVRYMQYSLYEKYAKKFGLGYKSLFVLRMLYTLPEGCTQNDICRSSVITKQTVSAIMKSYLSKGYISMEEITSDRRNKLVKLTEEGRRYADQIIPTIIDAEHQSMAMLGEEKINEMIGLCTRYAENLKTLIK